MALANKRLFTSGDYWALPDGERAELIDGRLYDMAPPSRIHQKLVMEISGTIRDYIRSHNGTCEVYPAPFAVDLDADDKTYVEPDISVICDSGKLTDRGCKGAPDWIIEIVSPASQKMDYQTKLFKYRTAGVKEYWIVNPMKKGITVYSFQNGENTGLYSFEESIPVGICPGFFLLVNDLV